MTVAPDAPPGIVAIPFRVVGIFEGMPIVREGKLSVAVAKWKCQSGPHGEHEDRFRVAEGRSWSISERGR
ncbi:MAG: hypothetical protein U0744_05340 [Gemmataceae bacterium]